MRTALLLRAGLLGLLGQAMAATAIHGQAVPEKKAGPEAKPPANLADKKYEDFEKVTKGAKEIEGLFKLWHKDENLYMEIKEDQLNKPYLLPIAIARGMGMGGYTLNFGEQWVLLFRKITDEKIYLVRRNVRFTAKKSAPVAAAVETTYTDSVLQSIRILSKNPKTHAYLISLNDIFLNDLAQLGVGNLDRSRSTWDKIKAFPRNIEIRVAATYSMGGYYRRFLLDDSVIDPRGVNLVIHYGLVELPDGGYQPRIADDRVGYFLSATKDFSTDNKDTSFVRYVNRWRLERAEGDAKSSKLSVPKKRIVYWVEKTVPHEYRAYVRDGILEWNKAFEKIGFRDAIEVRQQENEDFDPEDMNYNTFRWITSGGAFAMGPSRANPLTGELLDADIIFDADMVRYFKLEARILGVGGAPSIEQFPSSIQALKRGWTLPNPGWFASPASEEGSTAGWDNRRAAMTEVPEGIKRLWAIRQGHCQCAGCMKYELGLAALAIGAQEADKEGPKDGTKDAAKDARESERDRKLEELVGQAIKMVVMHEVGHTLGLRHNFKASTMLDNNQLNDTSITRVKGNTGSVMDYLPVNIAPKGVKQGDYFTTTIGPYDYWAIEYAYKPLEGGTEGELSKLREIAKRGALPGLDYGTDEDMMTADPHINAFDLGKDPMQFAQDRMELAAQLIKDLANKVVDKGDGYQRVRQAFDMMLGQYGNAAYLASQFVGGEHIHRDHAGDTNGRDPFLPVAPQKQRAALKFVQEQVLTDRPFKFPPQLLRRLAVDRWYHWGNEYSLFGGVDYPVHERILGIQRVVLGQLLGSATLARVQNTALKFDKEEPLQISEIFRAVTDSVWDFPKGKRDDDKKNGMGPSIIRRNLQREHLTVLSKMVVEPRRESFYFYLDDYFSPYGQAAMPADAKSLARLHLRQIKDGIAVALKAPSGMDDTARAHYEESLERINRVLAASLQASNP
jgi:hypothetical protein